MAVAAQKAKDALADARVENPKKKARVKFDGFQRKKNGIGF